MQITEPVISKVKAETVTWKLFVINEKTQMLKYLSS